MRGSQAAPIRIFVGLLCLLAALPARAQEEGEARETYDDADIVPDRERVGEGEGGEKGAAKAGAVPIYDPKGEAAPAPAPPAKKRKGSSRGPLRVQAFLVPADVYGGMVAGRVAGAVESELADARGYAAVDMAQELAVPLPQEVVAAIATGREQTAEGNKALVASQWGDAVAHLERAVAAYQEAALGLEAQDWADAQARLGAAHQFNGEEEFAQIAFRAAVLADPRELVESRNIHRALGDALESVRKRVAAEPTGTLSVNATAGARVFVDGVYRGAAPITVDRLPAGTHLVKVERAGMHPWAQWVEVTAGAANGLRVKLKATEEAAQLNKVLTRIAGEVDLDEVGEATGALGKRFRLDRAVVGAVSGDRGKATLELALVDYRAGKRLSHGSGTWETEGDTLERETRALVRKLLAEGKEAARRIAGDPLDRPGGETEEAEAAPREQAREVEAVRAPAPGEKRKKKARIAEPEPERKRRSADPLDDVTGMEEY